ncbi:hypothetical protein [Streptomonospora nanhaiensis]|uniref:hypothetical protein n=1 Tax=Streptomonospora nanhaiensis TaxID=1323731 RepID=UPI001C37FC82|nr:hypothetical protein [Streptomonospora nanhaiensis]MBV2362811.1 hypothetical protein [Streptomonospora nanhaiensis]
MAKTLTDRQQRAVFAVLVAALVVFAVYLSITGFGQDDGGQDAPQGQADQDSREGEGDQSAIVPPSPIPTTAAEDMQVLDWLPFSESELQAAAATAQGFAEAYGTIDYSESPDAYYQSMAELATEEYGETLSQSSGAAAMWQEMSEDNATSQGRANVESIRSFDDESVVFVVRAQSITTSDSDASEDLGEYAITVVSDQGEWKVFDFQPADAGNLGEG